MTSSARADRFIEAFNQIDSEMRRLAHAERQSTFSDVLRQVEQGRIAGASEFVAKHRSELRDYADLRNAITHGPQFKPIAEPLAATVSAIEQLAARLLRPLMVADVMSTNPVTVDSGTRLDVALRAMAAGDYSQLLVTTDHGLSLLNGENLLTWLARRVADDVFSLVDTRVEQVLEVCDDDGLACYPRTATALDVTSAFEQSISANRPRLFAVAITHSGSPTEKALGIVTPWDLLQTDA